jgi:16S rRNA (guanine966-N2)-methyltransferase
MKHRGTSSKLRIIGGRWRGRKLSFRPEEGLRPTTDRVRETLFNWLQPVVDGARCADLFAGSGALGLEALSRGAAHCDFVDTSPAALRQISAHLKTLGAADRGECHAGPAEAFLLRAQASYDIVFVDPPFGHGLAGPCCTLLARQHLIAEGGRVYLECAAGEPLPETPSSWILHRDKQAGGVAYRLFIVGPG